MKILDDQMAGIFLLGLYSNFEIRDISKLERLIARYIDNWTACDAMSCSHRKGAKEFATRNQNFIHLGKI